MSVGGLSVCLSVCVGFTVAGIESPLPTGPSKGLATKKGMTSPWFLC